MFLEVQRVRKSLNQKKNLFYQKMIAKYARRKGANHFARKMDQLAKITNERQIDSSLKGVSVSTIYGVREFLPSSTFSEAIYVEFEDAKLSIPKITKFI
ncbi:hypothetical protein SNF32_06685 [Enterococcus mundtii]|nr:hypothetical protein [Enterococcus mundtii]